MKFAKVLIECLTFYRERRRLRRFLREHGASYAVDHREEWKKFAEKRHNEA